MGKKLLIVQSQDNLRRLMGVFLSRNFEVISAKTGLEAMARLSSGFIPDVIIADAAASELGGVQLAASLQQSGMFSHIPFILIGAGEVDDEIQAPQPGIRAVFGNPLDPVKLQDSVKRLTSRPAEMLWTKASAA